MSDKPKYLAMSDMTVDQLILHAEDELNVCVNFHDLAEEQREIEHKIDELKKELQKRDAKIDKLLELLIIMRSSTVAPYLMIDEFKDRVTKEINQDG